LTIERIDWQSTHPTLAERQMHIFIYEIEKLEHNKKVSLFSDHKLIWRLIRKKK